MVDLQGGERSEAVAHLREAAEGQEAFVAAEVQLTLLVAGLFDVDHGVADGEDGHSASGERP